MKISFNYVLDIKDPISTSFNKMLLSTNGFRKHYFHQDYKIDEVSCI